VRLRDLLGAFYRLNAFHLNILDLFEVAILLGACFLVNYVTADSKTNWLEGYLLVAFYLMIVGDLSRTLNPLISHKSDALRLVLHRPKRD
jgi:Ca2+/Na+ antiporter